MTETLPFAKMHALGNDFVVLDGTARSIEPDPAQVAAWADRRRGIGFDQLLILDPPAEPGLDFSSRIYNADGSTARNCFNGARCLALFARHKGLHPGPDMTVGFVGGPLGLEFDGQQSALCCPVKLRTEAVEFDPGEPLFGPGATSGQSIELAGHQLKVQLVSVGNPHAIVDIAESGVGPADLEALGKAAQQHPWFPQGVNLSLIRRQPDHLEARVYERGAGATPACGTAAVAIGALALKLGWSPPPVHLLMGDKTLTVEKYSQRGILLHGEACLSYLGELPLP